MSSALRSFSSSLRASTSSFPAPALSVIMAVATSSVFAPAFKPRSDSTMEFATGTASSCPSPSFSSPPPLLSSAEAFSSESVFNAFSTSSSAAVSGSPRSAASFFSSICMSSSFSSKFDMSMEFTSANIPSIAGVFVKATEWMAAAFLSFFLTMTTGERYRYSLFLRYSFALSVHLTFATSASSPL